MTLSISDDMAKDKPKRGLAAADVLWLTSAHSIRALCKPSVDQAELPQASLHPDSSRWGNSTPQIRQTEAFPQGQRFHACCTCNKEAKNCPCVKTITFCSAYELVTSVTVLVKRSEACWPSHSPAHARRAMKKGCHGAGKFSEPSKGIAAIMLMQASTI